jgi:hypothetical protein
MHAGAFLRSTGGDAINHFTLCSSSFHDLKKENIFIALPNQQ